MSVTNLLQGRRHFKGHAVSKELLHLGGTHLNARQVSDALRGNAARVSSLPALGEGKQLVSRPAQFMVSDAHVVEAKITKG